MGHANLSESTIRKEWEKVIAWNHCSKRRTDSKKDQSWFPDCNINLDLAAIVIERGLNFENREGRGPNFSFLKGRAFR
jgi:hypothetical protein